MSDKKSIGPSAQAAAVVVKYLPNYTDLFGRLDLCECRDCRSVLSPAAYLVDLLHFLEESVPNSQAFTPYDVLIGKEDGNGKTLLQGRRPDLAYLPLTCENTNTTLPYVDLVNEILESYVALGHADKAAAHDTGQATAQELDANPQFTNDEPKGPYQALSTAVYPFTLPFNQPIAVARTYLEHLGTSRHSVLDVFRKDSSAATLRAINAEYLKITPEEYRTLTGVTFDLSSPAPAKLLYEYYGYTSNTLGKLSHVLEFLQRSGIAYTDLVELLKTDTINPAYPRGQALDLFLRIPFSFSTLTALKKAKFSNPPQSTIEALQQAGITVPQLADWSAQNYDQVAKLIVLDAADSKCDLGVTKLQHLDGTSLTEAELTRLHRFIRLWRKLDWSIADLGRALTALKAPDITPDAIDRLAQIKQLQSDLNVKTLPVLLSLWAPIDTHGEDALYKKLFLNKATLKIDQAFVPDPVTGSVLTDAAATISAHVPALTAAFRVSEADLDAIRASAGLKDDPASNPPKNVALSLANVSALYRGAALAKALKLRVGDLIALVSLSGIDPFAAPDQTRQFVDVVHIVQRSGFKVALLDYLYRHTLAVPATLAPRASTIVAMAKTLRGGLTTIAQDSVLVPDPTGDVTRAKLGLLFDSSAADQTVAMIGGTAVYAAPLAVLPDPFATPTLVGAKLSYDAKAAQLRFQGAMTTDERAALLAASGDPAYQGAVDLLFQQPATFIKNTLTGFLDAADAEAKLLRSTPSLDAGLAPVLLDANGKPTTDSKAAVTTAIAEKFAYALARLLPYLRDRLSHAFVKQTIVDALKLDGQLARLLLEDVLVSQADPAKPAIADLLALDTPGLTASYFASDDLTGAPAVSTVPTIGSGGGATPELAIPSGVRSARWSGMWLAPNSGTFTLFVRATGNVQLWAGDGTEPAALQPNPTTNEWTTAALAVKAGQLYPLKLEVTQLPPQNAIVELRWQSATTPKAIVPSDNLYPSAALDTLTAAYTRLQKSALLANTFTLNDKEIAYLSKLAHPQDFAGFDLNALPLAPDPALAVPALFASWLRVASFVTLRNSLPRADVDLIDVFSAGSREEAMQRLVHMTGWDANAVDVLAGSDGFNLSAASFQTDEALQRLQTSVRLANRIGVSPGQLFSWANLLADYEQLRAVAHDVAKAVHAKYDEATWLPVAKPLNDRLRQSQRDALVAYLLPRLQMTDSSQLFEYFLIDVDMAACMETSRIKQALSSVQLFVQRCLLNLEERSDAPALSVSPSAIDADQWEWMRHYRVWEANRKVFLYPENWVVPELRDDKSPFFKELESEILQNEATPDNVETAFVHYLEKLDQIARLEICGTYWQDTDPDTNQPVNILHVFARTMNTPRIYFYRQWIDHSFWTPWEKVPLDIEGDHLIPIVWNRRLHLIWPTFLPKSEPPPVQPTIDPTKKIPVAAAKAYWEIKLVWSEYKQGKWQPKQISSDYLTSIRATTLWIYDGKDCYVSLPDYVSQPRREDHVFEAAVEHDALVVRVFTAFAVFKGRQCLLGEFRMGGCGGVVEVGNVDIIELNPEDVPRNPITPSIGSYWMELLEEGTGAGFFEFQMWKESSDSSFQEFELKDKVYLQATPTAYRMAYPHQYSPYELQAPFFYQDVRRTYFVTPTAEADVITVLTEANMVSPWPLMIGVTIPLERVSDLKTSTKGASRRGTNPWAATTHLRFDNHFHPHVCAFIKSLNRDGIRGLLTVGNQRLTDEKTNTFKQQYVPEPHNVDTAYPLEMVDFDARGAYSIYNWELFFHAPLLIATRLTRNQRFKDSMTWLDKILNPMDDTPTETTPSRYWKVLPFKTTVQERIDDLLLLLSTPNNALDSGKIEEKDELQAQYDALKKNPFQPHLIARLRVSPYQKQVVMAYIDNLLAWGDYLFRQDTIEAINEATQLYVLAADLLGPRPPLLPNRGTIAPQTYAGIREALKNLDLPDPIVAIEDAFPFSEVSGDASGQTGGLLGIGQALYFCVPQNDKLLGYWNTVADRLFKIRHCMNIAGVVRSLALFEPPIDPALLVQAAAQGIDLNSALNDLNAPLPCYRFTYMQQKALEMCAEVRALGGALLSALEKKDAEELALLRSTHEVNILNMMEDVKKGQVDESTAQIAALMQSRAVAGTRYVYYQTLLGASSPSVPGVGENVPLLTIPTQPAQNAEGGLPLLQEEQNELDSSHSARDWMVRSATQEILASALSYVPNFHTTVHPFGVGADVVFGGQHIGPAVAAIAREFKNLAEQDTYDASHAGKMAIYFRRNQDVTQQSNLAAGEIVQIDKQITAANIRLAIAQADLTIHQRQMQDAQDVHEFLSHKYTNQDLYAWTVSEVSTTYFQCYQMAYELAKKAERAFRFERGLTSSNFIQFGYWDSLRKGLQSGDRLGLALKQMERAYLDQNTRDYEITKHVSLQLHEPMALVALKKTGECEVVLPESLFDADYPGHYMRRLKSVSITLPCVVGPYTGINCTLTLLSNKTRISSLVGAQYVEDTDNGDDRFVTNFAAVQSIATSHAQNDSGMFELNFRDERYLPFEGAGAESRWRVELPIATNAFNLETLTDVVLHLKYTAREGGDILQAAAGKALSDAIADVDSAPLMRLFSAKHEFPDEWYRFLRPVDQKATVQAMTLSLSRERFPYLLRGRTLTASSIDVFLNFKDKDQDTWQRVQQLNTTYREKGKALTFSLTPDGDNALESKPLASTDGILGGTPRAKVSGDLSLPATIVFQVAESDVATIAAEFFEKVPAGGGHTRLKTSRIDDMWFLVHYTAS